MRCEEIEALLDPYLDDEMTLSDTRILEQHIKNCDSCESKLKEHNGLHEAIASLDEEMVPRHLKRNIAKQLNDLTIDSNDNKQWLIWGLPTAAMAFGSAITAVILMFVIGLPLSNNSSEAFINAHINSLMADHITDVTSTDKHTVKPWFSGKLAFSPSVHKIAMKDLELMGGRLDYINNKSTASIVYKLRSHIINVFIQKNESPKNDSSLSVAHKSSYNMTSWQKNGLSYRVISDLNQKELVGFSQIFLAQ